ncbi:MAG: hypothetical protein ACE5F7_08025 [Nitrospiria bacterium]
MTGSQIKHRNGIDYAFENTPDLFEKHTAQPHMNVEYKTKYLRALREGKNKLLKQIENCSLCPEGYRRKLYKRLHLIDISKNEAGAGLEDLAKEVSMVGFNLRLNPTWLRGLQKLTDEIIDQTSPDERKRLSEMLNGLNAELIRLKKECNIFQLKL